MVNSLGIKGLLAASIAITFSVTAFAGDVTPASPGLSAKFNVSALQTDGSYNRFIVRYRTDSTEQGSKTAALQNVKAAVGRAALSQASLSGNLPAVNYQRKLATGADLVTTSRRLSQAEATALIQSIAADPAVAFVGPDVMRQAIGIKAETTLDPASFSPNDQYFAAYQTDYLPPDGTLTPTGKVANDGGANITGAWNLADGTGVTIAVLDTGIVQHADVNTSLANAGYDFISDAFVSDRATDDRAPGGWDTGDWTTDSKYLTTNGGCVTKAQQQPSSWHGTHVASASGAEITNNGPAAGSWGAGIAYNAKVLPVRVLGHCGGYDSDINDAIVWAAGGHVDGVPDNQNPAKVINLSLGGAGACPADDDAAIAIAKANALGAVVVVAAGNNSADVANFSPASCPGAITVASTGYTSKLSYYSNYNVPGESIIALAAPGGGVYKNDGSSGTQLNPEGFMWQALNKGTTTPTASPAGDTLGGMAGTSQATPHVTGTVALMQSARIAAQKPLLKPAEVLSILTSTAHVPKVTPAAAKTFGAGLLDAGAAVAAAAVYDNGGGDGGNQDTTIPLTNGVVLANQSGAAGSSTVYTLRVPAGALALTLRTLGGTGSVSIYVKAGSVASATNYDFKSAAGTGTAKSVAISRPRPPIRRS